MLADIINPNLLEFIGIVALLFVALGLLGGVAWIVASVRDLQCESNQHYGSTHRIDDELTDIKKRLKKAESAAENRSPLAN